MFRRKSNQFNEKEFFEAVNKLESRFCDSLRQCQESVLHDTIKQTNEMTENFYKKMEETVMNTNKTLAEAKRVSDEKEKTINNKISNFNMRTDHGWLILNTAHICGNYHDDMCIEGRLNWESSVYNELGFPGHNPMNVKFKTAPDSYIVPKNTARLIMINGNLVCLNASNNLIYGEALAVNYLKNEFSAYCENCKTSVSEKYIDYCAGSDNKLYMYDSRLCTEESKCILVNPKIRTIVKFRMNDERWDWCVIDHERKNEAVTNSVKFASNFIAASYYMNELATCKAQLDTPDTNAFPVGGFFDFNKNDWTEYAESTSESNVKEDENIENTNEDKTNCK